MKTAPLVLALSLAANAALAWFAFLRPPTADRETRVSVVTAADPAQALAAKRAALAAAGKLDPELWSDVSNGELRDVAARLKAENFPPSLQRAILAALISQRFAAKHHELAQLISAQPWWYGGNGMMGGAKVITMRQAIAREEKEMLESILGADTGTTDYQRATRPRAYGDLAPEKISDLERINRDYNELMQEVRQNAQGILLPEDREKLAFLEKEKRADIVKILSPEDLFEYDLRSSPSANNLRYKLSAFNPSEDEYRALFKIQQAFDLQYPLGENATQEQRQAYGAAQSKLTEQAQGVLSPERYAEFQQKTDTAYIQTNQLVTRLQLPDTTTADLVAVQKDIQKRAQDLRNDRALSSDQRMAQLGALVSEGTVRVGALIGENNIPAYRQTAGYWLNNLRPPQPKK